MGAQRLFDLASDVQQRIERTHWVLIDHRDVATADLAQATVVNLGEVLAIEQHFAAQDTEWRTREQTQHREHGQGLARTTLSDDAHLLARLDIEVDTAHDLVGAMTPPNTDVQIAK